MDYKNYYKIMGLEKDASQEEIKRVYRKLARKYHPDVSKEPNAENQFKELGEAYEVLKDPKKREKYDQYGQYWQDPGQHTQQNSQGNPNTAADFEEFINSIFGNQRSREHNAYDEGRDIHARLAINLEESFQGAEKTFQLEVPVRNSNGATAYQRREIKVKIPKGIADKQQIRLKGQGNKTRQGAGDLYIEINILPHAWFHLQDKNIYLELPISPWEATLGASIEVPTLAGVVTLKIPKLSQTGKQLRLKGRGLTALGDQIITLKIVIPAVENAEVSKLYEQMANAIHFNPRERLGVRR